VSDWAHVRVDLLIFCILVCALIWGVRFCSANSYFCGEPTYYGYAQGALSGDCDRTPNFIDQNFPRDHLADIFNRYFH
jgi:hypothetical protein